MAERHLTVPEPGVRALAHEMAYKIAREQLARVADVEGQCVKSGARYLPVKKTVIIDFLSRACEISVPDGEVSLVDSAEKVPVRDKILVLHYFLRAGGTPPTGKLITYKELQEGINYYPTFFKRAIEPIVKNFKDRPETLLETASKLGGRRADYGDAAVTLEAFPRVALTIVLWLGGGEFPTEGNILFDSTIADYLPTEDVTILSEMIAWKLVRLATTGGD